MKIKRKQNHEIVEFEDGLVFIDFGPHRVFDSGGSVRICRLGILRSNKPMSAYRAWEHVRSLEIPHAPWRFANRAGLASFQSNAIGLHSFLPVVCVNHPARTASGGWCLTGRPGLVPDCAIDALDMGAQEAALAPMPGVSFLFEAESLA